LLFNSHKLLFLYVKNRHIIFAMTTGRLYSDGKNSLGRC